MAKARKYGYEVGLYVSTTEAPYTWELVACLESKSINLTRAGIEVNTDCEQGNAITLPGNVSWTIDMAGHYITDPTVGVEVSSNDLFEMANSNPAQVNFWKLDDGAEYVRIGEGYFSSFTEDMVADGFVSFSGTISNSGSLANVELS